VKASEYYEQLEHDPKDPDPWLTLYLDQSLPLGNEAKARLLRTVSSRSRQFLLPLIRPLARLSIATIQILKIFIPNFISSSWILHRLIYWGLRVFVSPDANVLILRHMHCGTEILEFIKTNIPGVEFEGNPLRPTSLEDVKDDLFLKHDLNLFNFVISLNLELKRKGLGIEAPERLNFDCISEGDFGIEEMPDGFLNFLDSETAIELYTPLYQFFLTDADFWRASHSLQLDETIAIYVSALMGNPYQLGMINNRHPLVPLSTLRSGFRLMLHGLSSETLHALLLRCKRAQAQGEELPGFQGGYPRVP
tara:strand:+ start:1203 stop:2123 length:921 start_codon:yes stop_codon:yes gene_type:complete